MVSSCLFVAFFAFAFARPGWDTQQGDVNNNQKWNFQSVGKCEDECVTFTTCLYDTKNNYTEGHDQVKARDLTWDCMWNLEDDWVVQKNIVEATKCAMKVYEGKDRDEVEDCLSDNVYGPAIGQFLGAIFFQCVVGVFGLGFLLALTCAHCRWYKAPQNLTGTGFCCCKFWCPLAAVISTDRYQDTTAIAALFSWCGCIYTMCCWQPKPVELQAAVGMNNYAQMPPNQSRNVNWGV